MCPQGVRTLTDIGIAPVAAAVQPFAMLVGAGAKNRSPTHRGCESKFQSLFLSSLSRNATAFTPPSCAPQHLL